MRLVSLVCLLVLPLASGFAKSAQTGANSPRLKKAYRFERGGWVYVHLEGSPADIGYQHGFLLAPEIQDALKAVQLLDTHNTNRDWDFFRKTAQIGRAS